MPEQVMSTIIGSLSVHIGNQQLFVVQAYGNSKAAQIMFGEHLAKEIEARGANVKIIRFNDFNGSSLDLLNLMFNV